MFNQKLKRDCGRARNAQGSPKAGARAIFVQKNLAQPPYDILPLFEKFEYWFYLHSAGEIYRYGVVRREFGKIICMVLSHVVLTPGTHNIDG